MERTKKSVPDLSYLKTRITENTRIFPIFYLGYWMSIPAPFARQDGMEAVSEKGEASPEEARHKKGTALQWVWATAVPYRIPYQELRKICRNHGNIFYPVTGIRDKKIERSRVSSAGNSLSKKDIDVFIKSLPPQVRLMTELYLFANRKPFQLVGLFYTWEELLYLSPDALVQKSSLIVFCRTARYGTRGEDHIAYPLPKGLARKLRNEAQRHNHPFLLFPQEDGSPFTLDRLKKVFKNASERAKAKGKIKGIIVPLSLRPTVDPDWEKKSRPRKSCFPHQGQREISDEKLDRVLKLIPTAYRNAGTKRSHSLRSVLEAIGVKFRLGIPWEELSKQCPGAPPCKSLYSQYQRWKEKGVVEAILEILLEV